MPATVWVGDAEVKPAMTARDDPSSAAYGR